MENYKDLIEQKYTEKINKNPRYSLRSFAKQLEIDPGALSQILSGKRIPSYKMMQKFVSKLSLTDKQRKIFEHTVAQAHKKMAK
jgi:transcriptional regulator with XRE-family HTH domain